MLWTPGYWAWSNDVYIWNTAYWGPVVGFYGGVVYGFGYTGVGYQGGYLRGQQFYYNQSVNNVNVTNVHNVYNTTVVNNATTVNRVSYKRGPGGTTARPTPQEQQALQQRHVPPTAAQQKQQHDAAGNRGLLVSANHGQPPIAATPKPGAFKDSNETSEQCGNSTGFAVRRSPFPAGKQAGEECCSTRDETLKTRKTTEGRSYLSEEREASETRGKISEAAESEPLLNARTVVSELLRLPDRVLRAIGGESQGD